MSDHNVVLTVAAYASAGAAGRDFDALGRARDGGERRRVAAAILKKGPDGALRIDRSDGVAAEHWVALLGAALTVIAAPVGILFLQPVVTTRVGWAPVAALVAHFWQNIPQDTLRLMSDMLESSPAGLVIVAVDLTKRGHQGTPLRGERHDHRLDSTTADLGVDITRRDRRCERRRLSRSAAHTLS